MSKLKKGGFISSNRGQIGGYCLIKRPEEIAMWDVIQVMERTPQISCCNAADHSCGFNAKQCPIREAYAIAQENIEEVFQRITIADLASGKDDLREPETVSLAKVAGIH
jgi:Rrf2 family protein